MAKSQQFLYEVVPIRLFLIVMLVFYHAFAIFTGAWKPIAGYPEIPGYALLGNLSYACLLETFVFISGYIFGYQVRIKGDTALSAKKLLVKKFKRLIIPSIIFSIAYLLIIQGFHDSLFSTSYQILCGVAHMWFLPMLFWCFVIVWIIEKVKLKQNIALLVLLALSVISFIPLPLRLGDALYYAVFFYAGYLIQKNHKTNKELPRATIAIGIACFIFFFILKGYLSDKFTLQLFGNNLLDKALRLSLMSVIRLSCASFGIYILYSISKMIVSSSQMSTRGGWEIMITLSENCFGVYLFQQFVLKLIYNSHIPQVINPVCLPWISFAIALIISLLLTVCIRNTTIGKSLL